MGRTTLVRWWYDRHRGFQSLSPIANPALRESAEHGEFDAAGWKVLQEAGFPLALLSGERGGIGTDHAFAIAWLPVV